MFSCEHCYVLKEEFLNIEGIKENEDNHKHPEFKTEMELEQHLLSKHGIEKIPSTPYAKAFFVSYILPDNTMCVETKIDMNKFDKVEYLIGRAVYYFGLAEGMYSLCKENGTIIDTEINIEDLDNSVMYILKEAE